MALYKWKGGTDMSLVEETTFVALGIKERGDLQAMFRDHIDVIDPGLLVLSEEYGDWEESQRRIDLLCLDKDANLVVVELKRTEDGGHMELQAIRYAAMVSNMTFDHAVEAHTKYRQIRNIDGDARQAILDFLGWDEPVTEEFAKEVRIVLASQNFSQEITTAVLWLNDHDLNIRCVRLTPYKTEDGIFLNAEQVIPLPEAESYRVSLREKSREEQTSRVVRRARRQKFWTQMLPRAREKTQLHANNGPSLSSYISASAGRRGLSFWYAHTKNGIQADLYIDTHDQERNKSIFDQIHEAREEIEKEYGGELQWERLEENRASRISTGRIRDNGYQEDETKWKEIQDEWIDHMVRLEKALRPHIDKLEP